jgi:hypothetical protein
MPIDASIPLGVKAPDQMQNLSSLLSVAKGAQDVQSGGIALQEKQGLQQYMSNPSNFTDKDGNVDFNAAMQGVMKVAPTTGLPIVQNLLTAQKQHVEATSSLNKLGDDNRTRVANVLATIRPDSDPKLVYQSLDALGKAYGGKIDPWVTLAKQGYDSAVPKGPDAVADYLAKASRSVLPQTTQQEMNTPQGPMLSNGQQTVQVNTRPGVQGVAQGAPVQGTAVQQLLPVGQQDRTFADSQGNMNVEHRDAFGNVVGSRPLQGAGPAAPGPFTLPPGETRESMSSLQDQRTAAHAAANTAPQMHDINRSIISEVNKGSVDTGRYGAFWRDISSRFPGFKPEGATDYDILGKMLERSALTAAQSMGPHTNAGLEASIKANGSLAYTPAAIKKIAHLNDAIVSGSEMYRDGLEKAIGTSPNNVFSKREFDAKWAKVATPQALRLKNAVDNGDKDEIKSISEEVGGRNSEGAKKLHKQLTELIQLSGR